MKTLPAGQIHPALSLLPTRLITRLVARLLFNSFVHDTRQDFVIWEHKKYVSPPALAEGDGPIGKYRQWAKQFYVAEGRTKDEEVPARPEVTLYRKKIDIDIS